MLYKYPEKIHSSCGKSGVTDEPEPLGILLCVTKFEKIKSVSRNQSSENPIGMCCSLSTSFPFLNIFQVLNRGHWSPKKRTSEILDPKHSVLAHHMGS